MVGPQAEGVHGHRHEVAGLPGPGLDGRHQMAVGERKRQLGDVDDRVDARPAQHEDVDLGLGAHHASGGEDFAVEAAYGRADRG